MEMGRETQIFPFGDSPFRNRVCSQLGINTYTQIRIRIHRNIISDVDHCFQMVYNDYYFFFAILLARRYTDTQIHRYADRCARLLTIDACLFTKIEFLLSRMSTKIDFFEATGHDHGGW